MQLKKQVSLTLAPIYSFYEQINPYKQYLYSMQ